MEPLENNIIDFVRENWSHDLTDDECSVILWNLTAYPFCTLDKVKQQLRSQFIESDGDFNAAIKKYDDHMRAELKRLQLEDEMS